MLNLLIAIMQDSYDKVKEREAVEGLREKAKTIMAMELLHPNLHDYPRYMHVAEPETTMTDIGSIQIERDKGITGRIAERVVSEVDEKLLRLNDLHMQRMASLEASQRKLQSDVGDIKTLLSEILQSSEHQTRR